MTKRILSMTLAFLMTLSVAAVAFTVLATPVEIFAATPSSPYDVTDDFADLRAFKGQSAATVESNFDIGEAIITSGNTKKTAVGTGTASVNPSNILNRPNTRVAITLTAQMFGWATAGEVDVFSSSQMSEFGLRKLYQRNTSGTLRSAELVPSDSKIDIRMVEYYAKTGSTDMELTLGLTWKGKVIDGAEWSINVTIDNDEEFIDEGQEYVDFSPHTRYTAEGTVRNLTFNIDQGEIVTATKTVLNGQKYFIRAHNTMTSDDNAMLDKYPEIDTIYNLLQVNMNNSQIQFDTDEEYHVYNADKDYLGTTKEALNVAGKEFAISSSLAAFPYSSKFYLCTKQVDFGVGAAGEVPSDAPAAIPGAPVVDPANPPSGGDGVAAPIVNYNPNTGA